MCCFFSTLLFFGPRLAFFVYWLLPLGRQNIREAFNGWLLPIFGLIFLPWTTLIYVIVFPAFGLDWVFLGLALLADLAAYSGGYRHRDRFF